MKPSRTRVVTYHFWAKPGEGDFVMDVEARLKRAKEEGVITEYDDGRDRDPWFQGPPGEAIRALRDEFLATERNPLGPPKRPEPVTEAQKFKAACQKARILFSIESDRLKHVNRKRPQ